MGKKKAKARPLDTLEVKEAGGQAAFYINGRSLLELLLEKITKNPSKKARKHPLFIGPRAGGLDCYFYENPSSHPDGYQVPVFICNCGTEGCFDVTTTVTMDETTVTWRGVTVPLKGAIPGIGPFTFDREQYKAALGVSER